MTIPKNQLVNISAQSLLEKLGLEKPPYDSFAIAEQLGIKIDTDLELGKLNSEKIKISGSISMVNGQCIIFVNGFNIYARQRFTVAHELGHYVNDILTYDAEKFIDTATTLYRNDITDPKIDPRDIRANQFAAELLMPKKDILTESQALLAKRDELALTGELFIEKMAQIFQVSKPAMIIRLRKIGLLK